MTRRTFLAGLAAAAASLLARPRRGRGEDKAEKVIMVVHAENKVEKLGKDRIRSLYLGTISFWGSDVRVKPYNRNHKAGAGKAFFRDVLNMTPSRYRHHWQKRQLSGEGVEPEVVASASAVVSKVAAAPGGIGYILESEQSAADDRVRLVPIE